jgi:hypothetical protein
MNTNISQRNNDSRELDEKDLAAVAGGFTATDDLWRKKGFLIEVLGAKPTDLRIQASPDGEACFK